MMGMFLPRSQMHRLGCFDYCHQGKCDFKRAHFWFDPDLRGDVP